MMKRISEVIVVEGIHDASRLSQFFDCDTIITGGSGVDADTMNLIRQAQEKRGVIVFTDPDTSGEQIRAVIQKAVPGVKHAFIDKKKARTKYKVGVEHASRQDLEDSLKSCVQFIENAQPSLSWSDYIDFGLASSKEKRNQLCSALHIGPCNSKTCFKRLNALQITSEQIEAIL